MGRDAELEHPWPQLFFQSSLQGRDQAVALISTLTAVLPHLMEIARAHEAALDMDIDLSDHPVLLLVAILRWTHHTVNADVAFGEEREDRQESIFRLFDSCSSRIVLSPDTYAGSYSDAANMTAQLATQQLEPKPMTSAPDYSAPSENAFSLLRMLDMLCTARVSVAGSLQVVTGVILCSSDTRW